jgi:hypothetical protein
MMFYAIPPSECVSRVTLTVVQANEILTKIQNSEPVEYDYALIESDLSLSALNLTRDETNKAYCYFSDKTY